MYVSALHCAYRFIYIYVCMYVCVYIYIEGARGVIVTVKGNVHNNQSSNPRQGSLHFTYC